MEMSVASDNPHRLTLLDLPAPDASSCSKHGDASSETSEGDTVFALSTRPLASSSQYERVSPAPFKTGDEIVSSGGYAPDATAGCSNNSSQSNSAEVGERAHCGCLAAAATENPFSSPGSSCNSKSILGDQRKPSGETDAGLLPGCSLKQRPAVILESVVAGPSATRAAAAALISSSSCGTAEEVLERPLPLLTVRRGAGKPQLCDGSDDGIGMEKQPLPQALRTGSGEVSSAPCLGGDAATEAVARTAGPLGEVHGPPAIELAGQCTKSEGYSAHILFLCSNTDDRASSPERMPESEEYVKAQEAEEPLSPDAELARTCMQFMSELDGFGLPFEEALDATPLSVEDALSLPTLPGDSEFEDPETSAPDPVQEEKVGDPDTAISRDDHDRLVRVVGAGRKNQDPSDALGPGWYEGTTVSDQAELERATKQLSALLLDAIDSQGTTASLGGQRRQSGLARSSGFWLRCARELELCSRGPDDGPTKGTRPWRPKRVRSDSDQPGGGCGASCECTVAADKKQNLVEVLWPQPSKAVPPRSEESALGDETERRVRLRIRIKVPSAAPEDCAGSPQEETAPQQTLADASPRPSAEDTADQGRNKEAGSPPRKSPRKTRRRQQPSPRARHGKPARRPKRPAVVPELQDRLRCAVLDHRLSEEWSRGAPWACCDCSGREMVAEGVSDGTYRRASEEAHDALRACVAADDLRGAWDAVEAAWSELRNTRQRLTGACLTAGLLRRPSYRCVGGRPLQTVRFSEQLVMPPGPQYR